MNKLKERFEETITFKQFHSTLIKFDESLNCYVALEKWRNKEAELLTSAWSIFQELEQEIFQDGKDEKVHLTDSEIKVLVAKIDQKDKLINTAIKSIDSFFDNQVKTPSHREYSNFIADLASTLKGGVCSE